MLIGHSVGLATCGLWTCESMRSKSNSYSKFAKTVSPVQSYGKFLHIERKKVIV